MLLNYILDEHGNPKPADILEWAQWFEHTDRHVGSTVIARGVHVSTVYLGIDHGYPFLHDPDGPYKPVLWETMIFGGRMDGYQDRYTSLQAAKEGHERAVAEARAAEAGVKAWFLRRRDELATVWDIVSWFAVRRWIRLWKNKRLNPSRTKDAMISADRLTESAKRRSIRRFVRRALGREPKPKLNPMPTPQANDPKLDVGRESLRHQFVQIFRFPTGRKFRDDEEK